MNSKVKKVKKSAIDNNDEALEEEVNYNDENNSNSDEVSGEDLMNNLEDDYKAIPHLDKYEGEDLDDNDISDMDQSERRKVDEYLNRRDKKDMLLSSRVPAALMKDLEEDSEEEQLRLKTRKMRFADYKEQDNDDNRAKAENYIDYQDVKGSMSEWLRDPSTINYMHIWFTKFIKKYKVENQSIYEERINTMCKSNKQSLEVDFSHIASTNNKIAMLLIENPQTLIKIFNDAALDLVCEIYPQYSNIFSEIFVRIKDLPIVDSLRDLRYNHINNLIKVVGVITKRSGVFPQMKKINFFCEKCGEKKGPVYFNGSDDINIGSCQICGSKGPFRIDVEETLYRNYQKITIQESPGTVPPGRIPRYKEVIVTNDLVDSVRPGDLVEVIGIYITRFEISVNIKHSFPVFSTYIEAVNVRRINEIGENELTDDDKFEIKKLGKNPNIASIIFNSIAPSIYGHEFVKKALSVAMFGGMSKDVQGKHRIRGDINVLILGDPGLGKSQFLKYVNKVFHRSVYTTGKGASAVGLTAGVHKDPVTREWVLEGGALVLADKGICLIDEFDKMNDQDRTSIHEAMEQQSISISKAGIVTSLLARCSVIAAANPIKGRYNERDNFSDNVDLTEPILSRFDILCVVKDQIDIENDSNLSTFVINSHISSHKEFCSENDDDKNVLLKYMAKDGTYLDNLFEKDGKVSDKVLANIEKVNATNKIHQLVVHEGKEAMSQETLRKYIMYARQHCHPKLSDINKIAVAKFYSELRHESENVGGLPIATRHLESIIRMAEAHAKIHLREFVNKQDIDFGIKMMLESFLMSQKYSISKNMRKKFAHYLAMQEDTIQLLYNVLNKVIKEHIQYNKIIKKTSHIPELIEIKQDTFEREAKECGVYSFEQFYESQAFKAHNSLEDRKIIHKMVY